ncbi:hypothetical protein AAG906_027825 [Vitis piasezkii]
MEEAKTMKTPMSSSIKLDKDEKGKSIDSTMYRGMISSLLYLTASRPDIMYSGFGFGSTYPSSTHHSQFQHHSHAPRVSIVSASLSTSLVSFVSIFLIAPRRDSVVSRAQGKHPVEPSQPAQTKAHRKARFDTALFSSVEDYKRYKHKFAQRKVHFGFEGLFSRMSWLPIVTISEATYGIGGPIISTVKGVEIQLDSESIYRIFDIAPIRLKVRPGDGQTIGPQLDCDQQSTTPHDLLYPATTRRTLRRGQMKFEKAPNGSWIRIAERPPA